MAHHQTPRFYAWSDSLSKYVDKASEVFDVLPTFSYDAAWEDYNKDGWLDLVVSCSPIPFEGCSDTLIVEPPGMPPPPGGGSRFLIYRNFYDEVLEENHLILANDETGIGWDYHYSYEVSWRYVDADTLSDIFVCDLWTGQSSSLWINQGKNSSEVYTFEDKTSDWFTPELLPTGVRSAAFLDFDKDGDEDLVVTRWASGDNLVLYENKGAHFELSNKEISNVPYEPEALEGLAVCDFDLNDHEDIMVMPHYNIQPYLLMNGLVDNQEGVFSRYSLVDLGVGKVRGAAIADWNEDGCVDLFLGREPVGSQAFFYRNDTPNPADKWLQVRLNGGGGENSLGIGSKVRVTASGFEQTKVMRGKNGRGNSALELIFSLDGYGGATAPVEVTWPSGHVQTAEVPVNGLSVIEDDSHLIDEDSIESSYRPGPWGTDWLFEWDTVGPTLPEMDKVFVDGPGLGDDCYCGGDLTLSLARTDVEVMIEEEGGAWHHTLVWQGGCCYPVHPPCSYEYEVTSGNNLGSSMSGTHDFVRMKTCASGP